MAYRVFDKSRDDWRDAHTFRTIIGAQEHKLGEAQMDVDSGRFAEFIPAYDNLETRTV